MEQVRFNLLDEPWIPVNWVADGALTALSLPDVLRRAPELGDIVDASPLVVVSLYRLLLAVLHRNFGPANAQAWARLWRQGHFDEQALAPYFERWRPRFDLFDPERPFYQVGALDLVYAVSAAKLTHELASGNNATLFDHTTIGIGTAFSPAEAARYLIAHQAFSVGGLVSFEKGQSPALYKSAKAGPLAKGAVTLAKGTSVFATLLLNMHQYSPADEVPFACLGEDVPAWERAEEGHAGDRLPAGYLDLLTWQSRRAKLGVEFDGDGQGSAALLLWRGVR